MRVATGRRNSPESKRRMPVEVDSQITAPIAMASPARRAVIFAALLGPGDRPPSRPLPSLPEPTGVPDAASTPPAGSGLSAIARVVFVVIILASVILEAAERLQVSLVQQAAKHLLVDCRCVLQRIGDEIPVG